MARPNLIKVENSNFVRDINTRALINQDFAARDEYFAKVKMLTANKTEINNLNNEITGLKSELSEIKNLLNQLITR
jgi:hypothetical protein